MKNKRITFGEKYRIAEELKTVIEKDGDGTCRYKDGLNDTAFAQRIGATRQHVLDVRLELHGPLSAEGKSEVFKNLHARRLTEFEKRLSDVEARVQALEDAATAPKAKPQMNFVTPQPWKAS